jgi:hypothetical protein
LKVVQWVLAQERYSSVLFEGEKQIRWSDEDSLKLKELKEESDMSWVQIATHFEGRAVSSCKERYYAYLFEGEKRIQLPWTDEDSLKLKELREKNDMSWVQIADHFEGRKARSCKNRFYNHLFEGEKRIQQLPWSDEDSLKLKELKEKSDMSWEQIAAQVEGHTVPSCKIRYYRTFVYHGRERNDYKKKWPNDGISN